MYVVLTSNSEMSLYPFCTCACYAQSCHSSYSAVELVGLVLDHHYYEPSLIAEALQMP